MESDFFQAMKIGNPTLWERFLLLFRKKYKHIEKEPLQDVVIEFKKMFGKIYIVDQYFLPLEHPNCKCYFAPISDE